MDTQVPYEAGRPRAHSAKLRVVHRERAHASAEIIYLQREVAPQLPMADFGSGWYHDAAISTDGQPGRH